MIKGNLEFRDPRYKNVVFTTNSIKEFTNSYADSLQYALKSLSEENLESALKLIEETSINKGTIYFAGNGGSGALCNHLVGDFIKGTFHEDYPPINAVSFSENIALLTAISNDYGYENIFKYQIKTRMKMNDILIAVSSSGKSNNILKGVYQAKEKGIKTIGLTGFDGGELRNTCDISLHLPVNNYGVVEDGHSAILTILVQYISNIRDDR